MTESEIVELVRQVNGTWPNAKPVPPEALPVWFEDLADLETPHVRAAFTAYRRSGKEFPPTCAELRRLVLELGDPTPRFEHVWSEIHRAVRKWGGPREQESQDMLGQVPMAWALVTAMGGWQTICQGGPDEYKAIDAGVWRSQAEHAFRALLEERRLDQAVVDIPAALPRVRDANRRLSGLPTTLPSSEVMTPIGEVLEALPERGDER